MKKFVLYFLILIPVFLLIILIICDFLSCRNLIDKKITSIHQTLFFFNKTIPLFKSSNNQTDKKQKDHPDLALLHEIRMTKDPSLGYVPNDRKTVAYKYTKELLSGKAAIPGVFWTERGPDNIGGRTRALFFDPNDATARKVWAAGVDGGIWYNNDITAAGSTWNKVNDFWSNSAITTLAYDPSNTMIFYAGTGEGFWNVDAVYGGGIWKSTDGGINWVDLPSANPGQYPSASDFTCVNKIVVNSSGHIFAATRGYYINRGGIQRSTNGGTSWAKVLNPYTLIGTTYYDWASDIEIAANGDLYASFGAGSLGLIMRSTNNGINWANISPLGTYYRVELAIAPSASSTTATTILYAIADDGTGTGGDCAWIQRSTNGGNNWASVSIPRYLDQGTCANSANDFTRGQAWYDLIAAVKPDNPSVCVIGGVDVFRTTNSGTNWACVSYWTGACRPYVHADIHAIVFRPGFNNAAAFGTDGGVFFSSDIGNALNPGFTEMNDDYNVTQYYSCAMRNTAGSDYFLAGSQDNGSHKFTAPGINSITEVTGGDGAFCFIDQDNANYQITSYVNNYFFRSTNGGTTFAQITGSTSGMFINPADYDDVNNNLYAAANANQLYQVLNITAVAPTVNTRAVALGGDQISALKVSPYTNHMLFAGTSNTGSIYRITNANAAAPTSTAIGAPVGTGYVSSIDVGTNDNQLLITYSNYGVISVWETTNGGTNWANKEGNRPDMPIRWALYNPDDRKQVLLATELGCWSTTDISVAAPDWQPTNTGLANVRCDMLQYRSSDKLVAIATHGRGLYTTNVFNAPLPIELLLFKSDCIGNAVKLIWETSSETNNDYFTVQKSYDCVNFKDIAMVKGAGNSNSIKKYAYTDSTSLNAILYYRLKQTDFNGKSTVSVIIMTHCHATLLNPQASVYPNPFQNDIFISFVQPVHEKYLVRIFNSNGQLVFYNHYMLNSDVSFITINQLQNIPKGIYYINLQSNNYNYTEKIVKI